MATLGEGGMNLDTTTVFDGMGAHLLEATLDHFGDLGIEMYPDDHPPAESLPPDAIVVVAAIGYSGEKLRGDLLLVSAEPAIAAWQGAMSLEDAVDPCDTLGEFANMLLGRLKGRLLTEGIEIWLSTPIVTRAPRLAVASASGGASAWLRFRGPLGQSRVRLHAVFEPGFAPKEVPNTDGLAVAGDAMLF